MNRLFLLLLVAALAGPAAAQTSILSNGTLHVGGGAVIDLHGGTLVVGPDGLLDENGGRVTGGTLTTTRVLTAPVAENVGGLGAVITSAADLGETTITRGHTAQSGNGHTGILRYYDIAPTNNVDLDATLTFYYHPDELNGLVESDLLLFASADSGTTWSQHNGILDMDAHTLTVSGIGSFYRWTASSSDAALPVELTAFEAVLNGEAVVLRWATASETNNAGFEVEHRPAGPAGTWQSRGFVAGHGTTTEARAYTYSLDGLAPGTHRFRLRQVDYDGRFEYSPEVEVSVALTKSHVLSPAYPNPFNPRTQFTLALQQAQHVIVAVYDMLGRQVSTLHAGQMEAGVAHTLAFDAHGLSSGVYVIRVHAEHFEAVQRVMLMK